MAQPKAKTRLEQMGFVDPDIKNPSHDDLIAAFIPRQKWLLDAIYRPSIPGALTDWKISYRTEVPVTDRSFIIGFIDMVIAAERKYLCLECAQAEHHDLNRGDQQWCSDEHRPHWMYNPEGQVGQGSENCNLCQAKKTGICSIHGKKAITLERWVNLIIEFKTSKFTAGEVLRQLNTYRQYRSQSDKLILVTFGPCPHKPIIWNEKVGILEFVNNKWFMNWKSDVYDVYDGEVPE